MTSTQIHVTNVDAGSATSGGPDAFASVPTGPNQWVWIDVAAPTQATLDEWQAKLSLQPRVLARVLDEFTTQEVHPRYRPMDGGGWLSWRSPRRVDKSQTEWQLERTVMYAVVNEHLLLTIHPEQLNVVDRVKTEYGEKMMLRGPFVALRVVLDVLTSQMRPILEDLGDEIEGFEDDVLDDDKLPGKESLAHLYDMRRILLAMQHDVGPDRDAVRSIERQLSFVNSDVYRDYQDTGDQLGLIEDTIQTERDVASAAMDLYLSAQNNRMNEIMKQLTVVATIFMPLTLLSGIYGMNVAGLWPPTPARIAVQWGIRNPDLFNWPFIVVIASMVVIAVAMIWYFRRKKWW